MAEFRYFADPHGPNSTWTDEARRCELCGETRPGYEGPYYGLEDFDFVCEPCLVAGRLSDHELTTNEGDHAALREQLASAGAANAEAFAGERTAELEERTPGLVTWQDWWWPAHCGDFCRFERQVGQRELTALAPDGEGERFYLQHVDEEPLEWASVPPDGEETYDAALYLFRCVVCRKPVIRWDAS